MKADSPRKIRTRNDSKHEGTAGQAGVIAPPLPSVGRIAGRELRNRLIPHKESARYQRPVMYESQICVKLE